MSGSSGLSVKRVSDQRKYLVFPSPPIRIAAPIGSPVVGSAVWPRPSRRPHRFGPNPQIFDLQRGIGVFRFVKGESRSSRHLPHDGHPCAGGHCGRVEEIFLKGQKPSLGRGTVHIWSLVPIEGQLQHFDAGALLESLGGQHLSTKKDKVALVRGRGLLE